MALDDLLISTGVDQLIRLVKERGRIEIGTAAKELRLPMRTVEDWSHVLEGEGLIAIEYKLTKIYLAWRQPTSEYVAQRAEKLEAKASETRGSVEKLLSKVEKGGSELADMQKELSKLEAASLLSPEEAEKFRAELSAFEKSHSAKLKAGAEKLERLKKRLAALGPKVGSLGAGREEKAEVERELAIFHNFEQTLQSQLEDNETFFGAIEARLEDFRKRIEENRGDEALSQLRAELEEVKSLKSELAGAMEAMVEEQKSLHERISSIGKKMDELAGKDESIAGTKKRLAELRNLREEAKKQKEAVTSQLSDALSLVKKQQAKIGQIVGREADAQDEMQRIKEEYVDVEEELARANEELVAKQKEASSKISSQLAALEAAKSGAAARISKDELEKVSFLLRELKREQSLLEEKVRLLAKESEILGLEAAPAAKARAEAGKKEEGHPVAFVEKVKLSQEEEDEFERKRDELRSLIRKMWEESKGTPPS
jgi:chromosome segregation ATPase